MKPRLSSHDGPIVFFDGYCNLCNRSVLFIIRNDKKQAFQFASLQSDIGRKMLEQSRVQDDGRATLVLLEDKKEYRRSDAALRIARQLRPPWNYLWYARYLPRGFRDAVYRAIARYRYRIFGKTEKCYVPTTDLSHRFLDT